MSTRAAVHLLAPVLEPDRPAPSTLVASVGAGRTNLESDTVEVGYLASIVAGVVRLGKVGRTGVQSAAGRGMAAGIVVAHRGR